MAGTGAQGPLMYDTFCPLANLGSCLGARLNDPWLLSMLDGFGFGRPATFLHRLHLEELDLISLLVPRLNVALSIPLVLKLVPVGWSFKSGSLEPPISGPST